MSLRKKPVKKSLPQTGERQSIVTIVLGTGLLFLADIVFYIKRKIT
ncbi:LPXTG cell wall anchor domain-containing protein [Vagococcus elongatus]